MGPGAKPQRKLALSLGFLILSLAAFVWTNIISSYQNIVESTRTVIQSTATENADYANKISRIEKIKNQSKTKKKKTIKLTSLPEFLIKIDSIALQNDIHINNLRPDEKQKGVFHLEFYSDYARFESFISSLELLDVDIVDLQIHPYNQKLAQPIQLHVISLIPRNNAASLKIPQLTEIRARLGQVGRRNPFQRLRANSLQSAKEARIDLTWVHHLTAVTAINDNRFATINDHDYAIGDLFQGKTVTEVLSDHVFLEQKNKKRLDLYVLNFRDSKNEQ